MPVISLSAQEPVSDLLLYSRLLRVVNKDLRATEDNHRAKTATLPPDCLLKLPYGP